MRSFRVLLIILLMSLAIIQSTVVLGAPPEGTCFVAVAKQDDSALDKYVAAFKSLVTDKICQVAKHDFGDASSDPPPLRDKAILKCEVNPASSQALRDRVSLASGNGYTEAAKLDTTFYAIQQICKAGCVAWSCPGNSSSCWVTSRRCIQACN